MPSWSDFEAAAPALAEYVRERLDAHRHKILATLRRDGSPRISGTTAGFHDGDLWLGSMWQSRKALDLQRDPRLALHSASADPAEWKGDAKLSGRAEEITDPDRRREVLRALGGGGAGPSHLFRVEITEASTVRLGEPADHLVIDMWREGDGVRTMRRD
jgi:Pyridoxamine 5'-phosphate oxidase